MNILVVANYQLYENLSGSFVHQLSAACAALGHRVRVLIVTAYGKRDVFGNRAFYPSRTDVRDGVELVQIPFLSLSNFGEKGFNEKSAVHAVNRALDRMGADFQPDLIHAHSLTTSAVIGASLKQRYRCPLVITTHGSDTTRPLAAGNPALLRQRCAPADRIVAVSGQLAQLLRSCGTEVTVDVIHNGFVLREAEHTEKDPYALIQVGHLIPSKQFDATIRAFSRLKDKYPAMTLTLVGQGHLRAELEELCKLEGVADRVTFTGQIPNAEVFSRMCRASFFVMASAPEGFGIVYLEAMAAGCLTIGAKGQGIADIIEQGQNGYLVPAGDDSAIAAILDNALQDPARAATIAEKGRILARTMTWEHSASRYIALFRQLLQSGEDAT